MRIDRIHKLVTLAISDQMKSSPASCVKHFAIILFMFMDVIFTTGKAVICILFTHT